MPQWIWDCPACHGYALRPYGTKEEAWKGAERHVERCTIGVRISQMTVRW